ncbi:hypothetical protein Afil01_14620 [Actinorhabdospora filicis]|uniref:Uncharacterized protein n=1 Tax=Actinorhabdospora filicis TaxID=1785913 RepID=A0A9W6W9H9_9ACTN|nr:hypothetical protein [Actinorhabdospora filicis]GLZ76655.1 hypothetical protein Afil01_14620 [Actinorhabdospora filicis]
MKLKTIAAALAAAAAVLAGVAATTASVTAQEPKAVDTAIYDGSPWLKAPVRPPTRW